MGAGPSSVCSAGVPTPELTGTTQLPAAECSYSMLGSVFNSATGQRTKQQVVFARLGALPLVALVPLRPLLLPEGEGWIQAPGGAAMLLTPATVAAIAFKKARLQFKVVAEAAYAPGAYQTYKIVISQCSGAAAPGAQPPQPAVERDRESW
jgi:hypothetical protein